jgi:hypothetical protein
MASKNTLSPIQFWGFAVIAPIAAILLDPAVFSGDAIGLPFLFRFSPAGIFLVIGGTGLMAYWLACKPLSGVVGGAFLGFAVLACLLGMAILPMSLAGVFLFGIGLLGFLPFVTAYYFVRASHLIFSLSSWSTRQLAIVGTGFLMVFSATGLVQYSVTKLINAAVLEAAASGKEPPIAQLLYPFGLRYHLLLAWGRAEGEEKARLANAFNACFGISAGYYDWILND